MPGLPPAVQRSVADVIAALDREIKQLEHAIADHFNQHPHLRHKRDLLISIPRVGETTAARLLGEMLEFQQFSSAKQVAAYAGLSPRQRQSGSNIRGKTRLAKTGNPHLRKALFFPAIVARTHNPVLKAFADRLAAAGKHKMAIIGALMRKLIHIAYGVLKSGTPFNPGHEHRLSS